MSVAAGKAVNAPYPWWETWVTTRLCEDRLKLKQILQPVQCIAVYFQPRKLLLWSKMLTFLSVWQWQIISLILFSGQEGKVWLLVTWCHCASESHCLLTIGAPFKGTLVSCQRGSWRTSWAERLDQSMHLWRRCQCLIRWHWLIHSWVCKKKRNIDC